MACPSCGYMVDEATTTCPVCGRLLTTGTPTSTSSLADEPTLAASAAGMQLTEPQVPQAQPRQRYHGRTVIGLALAALLVLAGSAAAYVWASGGNSFGPQKAASAVATATATALPTDTPLPTNTPTPTATPRPTATPTPKPYLVTVFQDPLTSNRNGWYDGGGCFFQSDGYHVKNGYECFAPIASQSNVNVSVQVKQISGQDVDYGIGFRANGQVSEYYMFIAESGDWSVIKFGPGGQASVLIPKTSTGAIHQGLNRLNTLQVNMSGSTFIFFINGVRVGSATNGAYTSGKIGLQVDPNSIGSGLEVVYTNFKVTKWV
jgi:hypothetical protein